MPIYEYKCEKCDHIFEELLSIDSKNPECPNCKSKTKRLFSNFLGVVKGSTNRTLDCVIGEDAEKKWNFIHKRREQRWVKFI